MDSPPLTVAFVAGEPSGDRQGAALLTALRECAAPRTVRAWGIGGANLAAAGTELLHDSGPWAFIGLANALRLLPGILRALADMKRALLKNPPDALVCIDSGAFNGRLARWVKRRGLCPVFYFFPPGSWRRTAGTRGNLAEITDRIVTPFPWSAENLKQSGADARFVGHPLLDLVHPALPAQAFYERFGLDPLRPLVALLPGSRATEIVHILPALVGAAGEITRRIPGVQFALALGDGAARPLVEDILRRAQGQGGGAARVPLLMHQAGDKLASLAQTTLTPPVLATNEGLILPAPRERAEDAAPAPAQAPPAPLVICEGLTYDVLARSDLVITKSGTATLEAAILQKPMIIVYRGSAWMALEWKLRKPTLGVTHIGMPNILAQERLFPELIQDEATPEAISELAVAMLLEPERLLRLKEKLADLVHTNLGEPGGIARTAALLYETATGTAADKPGPLGNTRA